LHSFTTERLLIRPLAEQDKTLYLSLYTDAKVMRHIGEPLSVAAAEKAFSATLKAMTKAEPKVLTWAIVEKDTATLIGLQALTFSNSDNIAEIGIMLTPAANGRLFPEEAMGALMEYGFTHMQLTSINAIYSHKNLATERFVNKLGFTVNLKSEQKLRNTRHQYIEPHMWQHPVITTILPKDEISHCPTKRFSANLYAQ